MVAIARKEEVAAKRAVGQRSGGQPLVDFVDLRLRQRLDVVRRQRQALGVGEREVLVQTRRIGSWRRETDDRRRDRATTDDAGEHYEQDEDVPSHDGPRV